MLSLKRRYKPLPERTMDIQSLLTVVIEIALSFSIAKSIPNSKASVIEIPFFRLNERTFS